MKQVYIVEDSAADAEKLKKYVGRYAEETEERVSISVYREGIAFLSNYKSDGDVIFLDVEMPILSGIEVARKLREADAYVQIIFVTNMVQYALRGYEVSALDYVIKPISYNRVVNCLKRAFLCLESRRDMHPLIIKPSTNEIVRLSESDIWYVEKESNYLVYHTSRGIYRVRGQLYEVENKLGEGFSRCINGCLVNLRYVDRTTQNSVFVGGDELPIARARHKEFMNDLISWLGKARRY